jgi:hypothetical protein
MNAQTRKWFYLISGVIAALIPIGIQVGIIDTGQGDSTTTLLAGLAGLLGGGSALTAGYHTNKQIKEGLHDPPLDPIQQINEALPKVLQQQADANATVDMLRQIGGDIVGSTPVVGGLAQQVLDQLLPPRKD